MARRRSKGSFLRRLQKIQKKPAYYSIGPGSIGRRLKLLGYKSYVEYLESPHWQALRTKVLQRRGSVCQICDRVTDQVDVHHKTYEHLGFEQLNDLIVLCRKCHDLVHGRRPPAKKPKKAAPPIAA